MTSQQRPFPQTYYSGVGEKSQAAIITIKEGQRLEKYDLEAPPLPLEYDVEGIVLWANGTPATNARVGYGGGDSVGHSVKVDEQGRFSCTNVVNRLHVLHGGRQPCGEVEASATTMADAIPASWLIDRWM